MVRNTLLIVALGAAAVHACTLDFEQYRDPASAGGSATGASGGESTSSGGSTSTGGESSVGGAGGSAADGGGGAGGRPLDALGQPCGGDDECVIGECCDDRACEDTCMVPCDNPGDCPLDTMGCVHGYCLFPCMVDADCMHQGFICHHNCRWCEKKDSQGCGQ